jgi:hypothetical protein
MSALKYTGEVKLKGKLSCSRAVVIEIEIEILLMSTNDQYRSWASKVHMTFIVKGEWMRHIPTLKEILTLNH